MNSNQGSASVTLPPLTTSPVTPQAGYLAAAQSLMPGLTFLGTGSPAEARALAFLAAHVLECLLKAFLTPPLGANPALKEANIRHNLTGLWEMAASNGLAFSADPPLWVSVLGAIHGAPYHLRYQAGVHGMQLPPAQPMVAEIGTLLETVRRQVQLSKPQDVLARQ